MKEQKGGSDIKQDNDNLDLVKIMSHTLDPHEKSSEAS